MTGTVGCRRADVRSIARGDSPWTPDPARLARAVCGLSASAECVCDGPQTWRPWMLALVDTSPSGDGDGRPAARCAIAVSRPITGAGTGAPVAAAERPHPAAASTDASAAAPASTVSARAAGRVVHGGCIASPVAVSVGRSPRPAGCMPPHNGQIGEGCERPGTPRFPRRSADSSSRVPVRVLTWSGLWPSAGTDGRCRGVSRIMGSARTRAPLAVPGY